MKIIWFSDFLATELTRKKTGWIYKIPVFVFQKSKLKKFMSNGEEYCLELHYHRSNELGNHTTTRKTK